MQENRDFLVKLCARSGSDGNLLSVGKIFS